MNPDKTRQYRSNDGWGDKPKPQDKHLTGESARPVPGLCADCLQPNDTNGGRCSKCHKKVQDRLRNLGK